MFIKRIICTLCIVLTVLLDCYSFNIHKDKFGEVNLNVSTDIVSSYLWRGKRYGDLSFQESIDLYFYGFDLNLWFDYSKNYYVDKNDLSELDVVLSYTRNNTEISLKYIYDSSLKHYLSGHIMYTMYECPLSFLVETELYGDKNYSTYISIKYKYEINDNLNMLFELGLSPFKSKYSYKDKEFSLCNIQYDVNYQLVKHLFLHSRVMFNFFDIGDEKFKYGKNVNIMIGLKIEI